MAKLSFSLNRILLLLILVFVSYLLLFKEAPVNWLGFNRRELRLSQRLVESEDQVRWLGRQLRLTQKRNKNHAKVRPDDNPGHGEASNNCETIHICIVCSGHNASRTVVSLLKSILYYRRNPLVFHFVSDHSARKVLNHLAVTWNLSNVEFIFYKAETVINDVSWIPNKHYSGVYGLLKLTLPKILPAGLQRTIVLDTDVVVATDIGKLWALFKRFDSDQALGLVDNQSDWYIPGKLWKNHRPWPAVGRGFNTGVILMNLDRLRAINWWQLWRGVAENNLMTLLSTTLADQDIINTVISRQASIVYRLPCSWNIQLSDNSLSNQLCLDKGKEVNIVHFNSPSKFNTKQSYTQFFKNLHLTFQQFDGNLLRGNFFFCHQERARNLDFGNVAADAETGEVSSIAETGEASSIAETGEAGSIAERGREASSVVETGREASSVVETGREAGSVVETGREASSALKTGREASSDTDCQEFKSDTSILYRTHIFFIPYQSTNISEWSITLLASLSYDRLHLLEGLLARWTGPVSFSLYLTDQEAVKFLDFHTNSPILNSRTNVGYHLVYKESWSYPINFLRNVAKRYAETAFIFLSDIDFLPSVNLEKNLLQHVKHILKSGDKKVLVVPAFESERYRLDDLPASKAELLKQLDLGEMITFRSRVWPRGHEATNYPKWRASTQPYSVSWKTDFEPYIVGPASISDYDRRFIGFGWNKVSHIYSLHKQGYTFWVLPDVFIIHLPHTPSLDIHRFRTSAKYRSCMELLKEDFITEIDKKFSP